MSTLATWSHVVQSRDVSPHNFDGLAMSGLAFSVAPRRPCVMWSRGPSCRTSSAAAFCTRCSGAIVDAGRPANGALQ